MYAVHCILPRLVMWEQAIQRDLIVSPKYFAKFGMGALLRGDTASRFNAYKVAIENGWMCQDEARLLEDLNPIPNGVGKTFWRPVNWAPLSQISTPAPTPQGGSPDDTDTEDPGDDNSAGDGTQGETETTKLARLELLANSAADRCVRKEVAGLRRLVSRGFDNYQAEEFYTEQLDFVGTVLALAPDAVSVLRQHYFQRAGELCEAFAESGAAELSRISTNLPR
jgi:hypothetical protein